MATGTTDIKFTATDDTKATFQSIANSTKGLKTALQSIGLQAETTAKAFKWSQAIQGIQATQDALVKLQSSLNALTADSTAFGAAMRETNSMAGKSGSDFARLKQQVTELSKTMPIAREELAKALKTVVQSGVSEDNWIAVLGQSAKASVGAYADLNDVIAVTANVVKTYNMQWSDAKNIQDTIQASAVGNATSFEQLAQALPNVTMQAATMGVSFNELLATITTLSGITGDTSTVAGQLAGMLNAVTKASSGSVKMAQQMGVEWSASAIKAAGGWQNFLQQLSAAVVSYSEKTGMAREAIYQKLFVKPQAVKAAIALTGDLADKFGENMEQMTSKADTLDKGFSSASNSVGANAKKMGNKIAAALDPVAQFAAPLKPILNTSTQFGILALSLISVGKAANALGVATGFAAIKQAAYNAMVRVGIATLPAMEREMVAGQIAAKGMAGALVAGKMAMRGFLVSTGIGVALVALTSLLQPLIDKLFDTGDAAKAAGAGLADGAKEADSAQQAFQQAQSETYSRLMTSYNELKAQWKQLSTEHQKNAWITENRDKLKDLGLKIYSVKGAEDFFVNNTAKVVQSFQQRAAAAGLLAEQTELYREQIELQDKLAKNDEDAMNRHKNVKAGTVLGYATTQQTGTSASNVKVKPTAEQQSLISRGLAILQGTKVVATEAYSEANWISNSTASKNLRAQIAENKRRQQRNQARYEAQQKEIAKHRGNLGSSGGGGGKTGNTPKTTTHSTGGGKTDTTSKVVPYYKLQERSIDELTTKLQRAQEARKKVWLSDTEGAARWDAEIKRLQSAIDRNTIGKAFYIKDSDIKSVNQAKEAISDLQDAFSKSDNPMEQAAIAAKITHLEVVAQKFDMIRHAAERAAAKEKTEAEIRELSGKRDLSGDDIDTLLQDYQKLQGQSTNGSEMAQLQRSIIALTQRKEAMQLPIRIVDEQNELAKLMRSPELKIKLKAMGTEQLTEKIKSLQSMLDTSGITDESRKSIESLIDSYQQLRVQSFDTFGAIQQGWSAIEGVGNGIQGISNAISESTNAWQTITGVVDGAIQTFQSIMQVIALVNSISEIFGGNASQIGAAQSATATATVTNTAAMGAQLVATPALIVANKALTQSLMQVAAAQYFASRAMIPGGAIVAGAEVAAMKVAVTAIGATPLAKGGVVSGPTLAYVGEYSGAKHNPEVVAPLDRLRKILRPQQGVAVVGGEMKVKGRDLVAVLANETRISSKSGKRSNIVI